MGENRGHFGLAFDFYTHFTSPIRRYPDLFIHRVIKYIIAKKLDNKKEKELRELIPDLAKACSLAERNAEEAERESTDLKVTEYMSNFIGEIFKGVVSGVTSFGIFVRLPNSAEGLLRYENIPNDYFEYNPDRLQAKSQMTGKTIKIGDEMEVLVAACDVPMRKIEFAPVDNFTKKHGVRLKTSVVKSRDAIPGRVRNAAKKGSKPPRNRYERRKSAKRSGKRGKK
jgi:ribonuclease R